MTKKEFLSGLRKKLSGLPQEDIEERLNFYSEIIDDRVEEGLSEEEAVAAVGASDEIASQILSEIGGAKTEEKRDKPKRVWSVPTIVLIALGFPLWFPLLMAVLSITIAFFAVIFSAVFSIWAVFASLAGSAFGVIFSAAAFIILGKTVSGIAMLGAGLALAGLAIFAFFGCRTVTKFIVDFTKKAAIWAKNLFVKKGAAR